MATIQDPNEQTQPGSTGSGVNQPISGTGAAGTAQGNQTSAGASGPNQNPVSSVQQNAAPQAGSGYTDVSAYLNANPSGGTSIGNSVANNLTQGYNQTVGNINTSANTANSAVNSGYIPENTQLIQQVAANPTSAASDPNQTSAYQAQLNDTYSGPANWADYGNLQGQVSSAQQNANLLNTPGGNNVLVQQVENQQNPGQTSQGVNTLDTLLFGGNPNAVQTAQTAAQPYSTLNNFLDTQNTGITNSIAGAQNNAAQTSADALNAFTGSNGTLTNLNNTVNQTAATDLTNAQNQQTQLAADISNLYGGVAQNNTQSNITGYGGSQNPWYNTQNYTVGQLSPQDLSALGLTQDQWNQLQGALQTQGTAKQSVGYNGQFGAYSPTTEGNLNNFLTSQTPTASMINPGTVGTADQYSQTAAINQLLGGKAPLQTEALNPAMASEAGTYNPANLNSFDYAGALGQSQQTGAAEKAAAQQEANAITNAADAGHAASQHGGGFLGGLKQDITHPLNTIGAAADPLTWGADILNVAGGKTVNPTNFNPLQPQAQGHLAHGGEVKEKEDMDEFLNKNKVK